MNGKFACMCVFKYVLNLRIHLCIKKKEYRNLLTQKYLHKFNNEIKNN